MKKFLFPTLLFGVLFVISACSNDDIEIAKIAPKHSLTCNVSTQGLYDKFDLTTYVLEEYLRDESFNIGILTYLYDSNGNLIGSNTITKNNYNAVKQTFTDLVEGKYTVVTIETLLNPDTDNKPQSWSIDDIEKLSSLKITQKNSVVFPPEAIGVSTQEIELSSDKTISISPEAIGAVILSYSFDFEESAYTACGFATTDILKYYSLDPTLERSSRFTEDQTKKGWTNIRAAITTEESSGVLYWSYVLESEINCRFVATSEEDLTKEVVGWNLWPTTNIKIKDGETYYIGSYYLYETEDEKTIIQFIIGSKEELDNWYQYTKEWKEKNVKASLFKTPYIDWEDGSVSAVKKFMSGFSLTSDIASDTNGDYSLSYKDANNYNIKYVYKFSSSTSGLKDVYIYFYSNATSSRLSLSDDELNALDVFTAENVIEQIEKQGFTFVSQKTSNPLLIRTSSKDWYYSDGQTDVNIHYSQQRFGGLSLDGEMTQTLYVNYYPHSTSTRSMTLNIKRYDRIGEVKSIERKSSFPLLLNEICRSPFVYRK